MRELWELIGLNWKLPIGVYFHGPVAEVRIGFGLTLLKCQFAAARELLVRICNANDGNAFYVTRDKLEANAFKAETDDPEQVVDWNVHKKPVKVQEEAGVSQFIHQYCESKYAAIRDPILMEVIWVSLCKWMIDWLLNHQKPIDLEWATLYPLQLRRNWKNCLVTKEAKVRSDGKNKELQWNPELQAMIDRGIVKKMTDSIVTGFILPSKTMQWTVDLCLHDSFVDFANRLEIARKRYRKNWYYHRVIEQLKRQLPYAIECYSAYLAQARTPYVELPNRSFRSNEKPVKTFTGTNERAFEPSPDTSGPAPLGGQKPISVSKRDTETEALLPQELSDLQQGKKDLWHTGPEPLPEPGDGTAGAAGMPLLHTEQIQV